MGYLVVNPSDSLQWLYAVEQSFPGWRLRPKMLRQWRQDLRWSQLFMVGRISEELDTEESSKALDLRTYQRWERGQTQPQMKHYKALQRVFCKYWPLYFEAATQALMREWKQEIERTYGRSDSRMKKS